MDPNFTDNNTETLRRCRKYSNSLVISGIGVIFLGFWSVLKLLERIILGDLDIFIDVDIADLEAMGDLGRLIMYILFTILMLVIIIIYSYTGLCAIKAGRSHKKKYLYLIIAALLLALTIMGLPSFFRKDVPEQMDLTIAAFLVEIISAFAFADLIYSTFMMWYYKKKASEE